jgi:putative FmdB family regulatory protein
MPVYEYYCPSCRAKYELLRPMRQSDEPGTCPAGHRGGARVLSGFATLARDATGATTAVSGGGGCGCGGACACGGH